MRRLPAAFSALLLTTALAACTGDSDDDGGLSDEDARAVEQLAGDLAAALSSAAAGDEGSGGSLEDLPYVDRQGASVAGEYDEIVAGMDGVQPDITVGDVAGGDGGTTVALDWSWPLLDGEATWSYRTEVPVEEVDGGWEVAWTPAIVEPSLRRGATLDAMTVEPERGRITGAGKRVIVEERPVVRFGIDKLRVPARRAPDSARALAELVGVDAAPYVKAVKAAGDRAFVEAIVYRAGEVPAQVQADLDQIDGAVSLRDEMALAPTREFAAPILGRVGPVTAEMIEEDPDEYQVGDVAGVSGLQLRYDDQLRGTPGVVVRATYASGRGKDLFRADATDGENLALTLDIDLQTAAERLLADVEPESAIVALRPSDGAILAAANGPGNAGQNFATYGQYPPGSTFKIVSSLALLRAGLRPGRTVSCPPAVVVDGKRFENYDDYPPSALGSIPFRTAVAQSCNTAFISQYDALGDRGLAEAAASLGLGVDHDLGFPAYFGSVEPPASDTGAAANMIGQGTVLASPMAMAAVVGSVQQGELVVPRLVEQVEVEPHDHQPLTGAEAGALRDMLRAVVTQGSGRALADVPGPPVIAKTGTAEFESGGGLRTHAWMVAAQGDLAVAVFVGLGESGSQSAGPILEAFLRAAR